ncbi:MAG: hypothetical protein WCG91_03965 [Candidatus Shapirobacteria bacterium]
MPNFNLSLSPEQIEYVLKPGITITQAYEVTNNSDNAITISTEVLAWQPSGNNGNISYQDVVASPNIIFSLNNADIKLGQTFSLAPKAKQQLVLKVSSAQETSLEDYYYTFFVTQQSQNTNSNNAIGSQATGKIGSNILLTVSNSENTSIQAQINKFTVSPKIKDVFFTPLTFKAEIKNNSQNFFKTKGTIIINKNDLKIKELELNDNNVLANYSRNITCKDQDTCTIQAPFWPGRYTATLKLDESINAPSANISFFVFPFSIVAILILFLAIFLTGFKLRKRFIEK